MSSTFPRIATLVLALSACTASTVPVGTNSGELGTGSDSGSQSPCEAAVVPTIACASGPTVQTCDTATTPPSWKVTCAGESGGSKPSGPANPCGDMAVDLIGCASGEPNYICDGAGTASHWTIACHGTIGVPNGDAGTNGSVGSDSGTTACDGLPVETIGCASGEPVYTCVVDSGAPHWNIGCQ